MHGHDHLADYLMWCNQVNMTRRQWQTRREGSPTGVDDVAFHTGSCRRDNGCMGSRDLAH